MLVGGRVLRCTRQADNLAQQAGAVDKPGLMPELCTDLLFDSRVELQP